MRKTRLLSGLCALLLLVLADVYVTADDRRLLSSKKDEAQRPQLPGAVNAIVRPSGFFIYPVELMSFTIDEN